MSRLAPAAAVHGLADFIVSKITLGAITGMPKPSSGNFAQDIVTHMVKTGGKEVAPETIQTMAERYGAKLNLADAEAMSEYVNTAAAAMVMGAVPGGVGGARTYLAGKQAKDDIKDEVKEEVDTSSKTEDKTAEEVAKETLTTAPPNVAEAAVAGTLNTVPNPELDPKIDEVTAKIKELQDDIEAGENYSREDYTKAYRQLGIYEAELEGLIEQKAAAQEAAVATGEATPGQKLKDLAAGIKAAETPAAPATELDAEIARIEAGIASGEEYKHPKALAAAEAKLARLKAQRETQDVTGADVGTSGAGVSVPTGPSVAPTTTTTESQAAPVAAAPTIQSPAVGGTTEQLDTLTPTETKVEPAAVEPAAVEPAAVEPTPAPAPKKARKAKVEAVAEKNELAYFNQPTFYGERAPTNTEEGMHYAANEHGFDNFDAVDYDKGVKPALEAIVKEKNAEQAEKRAYLEAHKDQYSDEDYKKQKAAIKDYNISNPLEFMSLDELTDLYASHISEKPNWKNKGGKKRTDNMVAREQFLATLSPEQRAQVQDDAYSAFMAEVKQDATSRLTTAADKRKAREKRNAEARKKKAIQGVEKQLKEEIKEAPTEKPMKPGETLEQWRERTNQPTTTHRTPEEVAELHRKIDERIESTIGNAPRLNEAVQSAIQSGASLREILDVIANRRLNDSTTAIYADNLLALLKAIGDIDVTFSIGAIRKAGADGSFNPAKNHITVKGKDGIYTGERKLAQTVLHEIMHFLTDHVVDNEAAYLKTLPLPRQAEVKAALNRLKQSHKLAQSQFGTKYNIGTLKEFIAEVFTNRNFQKDLATVEAKVEYVPKSSLFTRVVEAIARALSLTKDTGLTLRQALSDISEIVSLPTAEIKGKATSYAKTVSEEEEASAIRDDGEIDPRNVTDPKAKSAYSAPVGHIPKNIFTTLKRMFWTREGWRKIVTNVQNERHAIKTWENKLALAGRIIYDGIKQNAVYTELTRATALGRNYFNTFVRPLQNQLEKQVYQYAKAAGMTVEESLDSIHRVLEALHEPERRLVKYVLSVPLQAKAANRRDAIMKQLNTQTLDKKTAVKLRAELDALVFDYDAQGRIVPNMRNVDAVAAGPAVNIDNEKYNVTGLSPSAVVQRLQKYEESKHKDAIDRIAATMQKIHNVTTELNKKANYWSQPVTNRVNFYGFENYIPLKGITKHSETDEYLDFDGVRMGKELQDVDHSFEGRITVSDNPVLQTMSDAVRASLRAGRRDLTLAIKNAVEQKLISGKVNEPVSFEDRQNEDFIKKLPRKNTVFHYNQDGSIQVIEVYNEELREAIRRTYRSTNPLVDFGNKITSTFGQMHTRYNYMFAPINFVRDSLTNAWTMGAELGPKQAVKRISQVATQVVDGNMVNKAFRIAKAYESKDAHAIDKFRKSNDPYVKNIIEFLEQGGMVEYLQGVSLKSNFQRLYKDIGRGGLSRTKEKLDAVVDVWTDMFEIASRAAAYNVSKQKFIAQGMEEAAAQKKAAAYTKNLANFEQVGKYGKEWGSLFMFFRPAATGAVRAVEALLPAFVSSKTVISELPAEVRNDKAAVEEFKKNYAEQQKNARYMTVALMSAGAFAYLMAYMMADDDDLGRNKVLTDDMSMWARNARFFIPGMEKPIQIPWGFGMGAFASAGAQMAAIANGSQGMGGFFNSLVQLTLDSFLPIPVSRMSIKTSEDIPAMVMDSLIPSGLRPMLEFVMNKNGLGNQIYNDTNKRMGDAYLGGDNIPEWYKSVAKYMVEATNGSIDVSPNSLYFFGNSYFDGPLRVFDMLTETAYAIAGNKDFDSNLLRKVPLVGSFIGAAPNVDARQFNAVEQQVLAMDAKLNMFKTNPEQLAKYIDANPMAPAIVAVYNKSVAPLNKLRHEGNVIRSLEISPKDKADILKANKDTQNLIKYHLVELLKDFDVKP